MVDVTYAKNSERKNKIEEYNAKVVNRDAKQITFGDSVWSGIVTDYAPANMPRGASMMAINIDPKGTYLEKPVGVSSVGKEHTDINIDNWIGVIAGEVQAVDEVDIKTENNIFKIVRSKEKVNGIYETIFYYLDENEEWKKSQPYNDYWVNAGVNPEPSDIYNFRGNKFAYTFFRGKLYICSGEEQFHGQDGISGLMVWDADDKTWNSILTGKAGFIKNTKDYLNKSLMTLEEVDGKQIAKYTDGVRLYDSPHDFNPSLVTVFQERLFISGATANPLQVKMSEWNNPENFTQNVLGLQGTPLTTSDTARPSSFIVTSGADKVTSINPFNNALYVGTNKGMYIYNLLKENIADGVTFQLESLVQNNYTLAGPVSNYAVLPSNNSLFYIANYQVVSELSAFSLKSSTTGNNYSYYEKLSGDIDDLMNKLDVSSATIGQYENKLLISLKTNGSEYNNITLLASPMYDGQTTRYIFSLIDYIDANHFFNNNRGCYFVNNSDGRLYKIVPSQFNITIGDQEVIPVSIWQSGWTGYNPKKDSVISKKTLKKLLIQGYFSNGSVLELTCGNDDGQEYTFEYKVDSPEPNLCVDSEQSQTMDSNVDKLIDDVSGTILHRYGNKYKSIYVSIPDDVFSYKQMYLKIKLKNSRYFYIESYSGVSKLVNPNGLEAEKAEGVTSV